VVAAAPGAAWRRGDALHVYVRMGEGAPADAAAGGLAIERIVPELGLVQGWIDAARLDDLAPLPRVPGGRPAEPARPRALTSEGDAASRADLARALGWDGSGVTVGVLSTGADDLDAAQAAGELPDVGLPCGVGEGGEGTAVLEIVHDLAPGAQLLFA